MKNPSMRNVILVLDSLDKKIKHSPTHKKNKEKIICVLKIFLLNI